MLIPCASQTYQPVRITNQCSQVWMRALLVHSKTLKSYSNSMYSNNHSSASKLVLDSMQMWRYYERMSFCNITRNQIVTSSRLVIRQSNHIYQCINNESCVQLQNICIRAHELSDDWRRLTVGIYYEGSGLKRTLLITDHNWHIDIFWIFIDRWMIIELTYLSRERRVTISVFTPP